MDENIQMIYGVFYLCWDIFMYFNIEINILD